MAICLEQSANDLHMVELMPLSPPPFLASLKSRMALPFCYQLTQVIMEKRLLKLKLMVLVVVKLLKYGL